MTGPTLAPVGAGPLLRSNLRGVLGTVLLCLLLTLPEPDSSSGAGVVPPGGMALVSGSFLLALLFGSGLVQPDFKHGALGFWAQKPVSIPRLYLRRWAIATALAIVAYGALAALIALAGPPGSWRTAVDLFPRMAASMVVVTAIGFAWSAAGVHLDVVATVVVVLGLGWLGHDAALTPDAFGWTAGPLQVVGFPWAEFTRLGGLDGAGWDPGWTRAARHLALYGLAWLGSGTVALEIRLRRALLL